MFDLAIFIQSIISIASITLHDAIFIWSMILTSDGGVSNYLLVLTYINALPDAISISHGYYST